MVYVAFRVWSSPGLAPPREPAATGPATGSRPARRHPVIVLIAAVIGSMYVGIVTPTEAAALGCLIAVALALAYRELSWARMKAALRNAGEVTSGVVMFITLNAQILNFAVVTSGIGQGLAQGLAGLGLSPLVFFCLLFVVYLVVGMFIDGLSIMLLTVPCSTRRSSPSASTRCGWASSSSCSSSWAH